MGKPSRSCANRMEHLHLCSSGGHPGSACEAAHTWVGSATSQTVTCWFLFAWLITLVDKTIVVRMGSSSVSLEGFTDATAWVTASTTGPVALQEGMARGSCVGMQGQRLLPTESAGRAHCEAESTQDPAQRTVGGASRESCNWKQQGDLEIQYLVVSDRLLSDLELEPDKFEQESESGRKPSLARTFYMRPDA